MQKTIILMSIVGILALSFISSASAIYEDQLEVCNFESECVIIDIDDFMSKEKSDKLWSIFENDIDTYDILDMTVTPLK